jgi:hypothetical protein
MPASEFLQSVDQRLARCRQRVEQLRTMVSEHPDWHELPRVLSLAEESLRDLQAHRATLVRLQQRGTGGATEGH